MAFIEAIQIGRYSLFPRRSSSIELQRTKTSVTSLIETPEGVVHRVTQAIPEGKIEDAESISGDDFNREGRGRFWRFGLLPVSIIWDPDPAVVAYKATQS